MKKLILGILGALLVIGLFAGAGFTGYRIGLHQGAQLSADGNIPRLDRFDRDGMPRFAPGFDRRFTPRMFVMMHPARDFGFFSLLFFVARLALIALLIWFVFWLFTRSGWRLSLTRQSTTSNPVEKSETEIKE